MINDFKCSYHPDHTELRHIYSNSHSSIEWLSEENPNFSDDIWSLGTILYTLMAREKPYPDKKFINIFEWDDSKLKRAILAE